jgi:hypothetical protein
LKHSRRLLIGAAVVAGVTVGALAYWSGSGSGTATTVLTDAQTLSFEPGTPTAQLYPGGETSVVILATNPNPFFVHIGSMVLDTDEGEPFVADATHGGCDVSTLSFVTQDNGGAGWEVPPQAGTTDGTLTIDMPAAMQMSAAAPSACQGATFTVHLEGHS